jgi:hypothetical protein
LKCCTNVEQRGALCPDDADEMKSLAGEVSKCETALKAGVSPQHGFVRRQQGIK